MDWSEFAPGDQVRANELVMVVEEVYAPIFVYRYRCTWVTSDGHLKRELFRPEQLELVTRRPGDR